MYSSSSAKKLCRLLRNLSCSLLRFLPRGSNHPMHRPKEVAQSITSKGARLDEISICFLHNSISTGFQEPQQRCYLPRILKVGCFFFHSLFKYFWINIVHLKFNVSGFSKSHAYAKQIINFCCLFFWFESHFTSRSSLIGML